MKARLIKPGPAPTKDKASGRSENTEAVDKVRSWVDEFKSRKANQDRLDLWRIKSLSKS